jgi:glycosyltransferase involved in cell wall biosynthesis
MKIAQIIPVWSNMYQGHIYGITGVAYDLCNGLVEKGHQVDLYAKEGSLTKANLKYIFEKKVQTMNDPLVDLLDVVQAEDLIRNSQEYDIIHSHIGYAILPLVHYAKCPVVITIHSSSFGPEAEFILKRFKNCNFISLTNKAREQFPYLNFVATVNNGINLADFEYSQNPERYLAWIGRVDQEKGLKEAINVVKKLDLRLKAAGIIAEREDYFKKEIEPLLDKKREFLGPLFGKSKTDFLKKSFVLLNPISSEEPFGLVMVEAMACGTPVIAFRRGSVPEVVKDGETGFIVEPGDIDAMVEAVKKIYSMPEKDYLKMRRNCRLHVEKFFTVEKMVDGYEKVYKKILNKEGKNE